MVFAMILALTIDTDDEKGKNRERSNLWGSPTARALSWVSLPPTHAGLSPLVPQNPRAVLHMSVRKQVITPRLLDSPWQGKTWAEDKSIVPFPCPEAPCRCPPMCSGTNFAPATGTLRGAALPCHNAISACTPSTPLSPRVKLKALRSPPQPSLPRLPLWPDVRGWQRGGKPFSQCFSKSLGHPCSLLTLAAAITEPVPMRFPT